MRACLLLESVCGVQDCVYLDAEDELPEPDSHEIMRCSMDSYSVGQCLHILKSEALHPSGATDDCVTATKQLSSLIKGVRKPERLQIVAAVLACSRAAQSLQVKRKRADVATSVWKRLAHDEFVEILEQTNASVSAHRNSGAAAPTATALLDLGQLWTSFSQIWKQPALSTLISSLDPVFNSLKPDATLHARLASVADDSLRAAVFEAIGALSQ